MPTDPVSAAERHEELEELEGVLDQHTGRLADARAAWAERVEEADAGDADELFAVAAIMAELQAGLRAMWSELADITEAVARSEEYDRRREERKRQAAEAAKLNTALSDEQVLEALRAVLTKAAEEPTTAGEVARQAGARPTHSDRIRAGLALGRLAREGKVRRIAPRDPSRGHLWGLPGGAS